MPSPRLLRGGGGLLLAVTFFLPTVHYADEVGSTWSMVRELVPEAAWKLREQELGEAKDKAAGVLVCSAPHLFGLVVALAELSGRTSRIRRLLRLFHPTLFFCLNLALFPIALPSPGDSPGPWVMVLVTLAALLVILRADSPDVRERRACLVGAASSSLWFSMFMVGAFPFDAFYGLYLAVLACAAIWIGAFRSRPGDRPPAAPAAGNPPLG